MCVQMGVDDIEYRAVLAEGLDPEDPDVVAGLDFVRWELAMMRMD